MFGRHRVSKTAREICRHAVHLAHLRGDILPPADLDALRSAREDLEAAIAGGRDEEMIEKGERLGALMAKLAPPPPNAGWRENIEVIVVACAVAMAFRAYFIQPFKIPTGSMQPTLNGIRYEAAEHGRDAVGLTHRMPLKLVRWLLTGEWYVEVRAKSFGRVEVSSAGQIRINDKLHHIPPGLRPHVHPGETVVRGQLLASGIRESGDHLFVNKVAWNFRRPHRGEVMVFLTDNIEALKDKKTHYIKRMVGLPGERISLDPPMLLVNGGPVTNCPMITLIESGGGGDYIGYQYAPNQPRPEPPARLNGPGAHIDLNADQFLGFGDNQASSLDSRFWGPVPRTSLVGPACFVYWPIREHWGLIR